MCSGKETPSPPRLATRRTRTTTTTLSLIALAFFARVSIGAWCLREYARDVEKERTSGGSKASFWLFLTSGVEAIVRASVAWREEKGKKRRWSETFVYLATRTTRTTKKKYFTIRKMVDIARAMSKEKESVGEMLLSASFVAACVVVLAFFGTEEDSLWPTIYVCAILMKEVFDRRFMIVRFVLKHRKYWFRHRKLYVSLNDDFDFDVQQQRDQCDDADDDVDDETMPKIAVGAFANSPGDKIYIIGKFRDQLFDRILDGTHCIIHQQTSSSSSSHYLPSTFTDHHIRQGMISTETCPRFLCFEKEEILNNILAFTKEEDDGTANEINLRAKITNGLMSLMMTPRKTTDPPTTPKERKFNTTRELHVDNVGVLYNTKQKQQSILLNNINDIAVGRVLVSGRHFVFLKNPPASIASNAKIARLLASKTCVYSTNNLVVLKKNTRVVFANKRGGNVSFVGTFASLLTEKNFGSEFAKTFLNPCQREEEKEREDDEETYAEPVAKIETACYRLLRYCRKGRWPKIETILDGNNRATLLAFSSMIGSLTLIAAINADSVFIDSTAFIVSVFAPLFLCILIDLVYTKTWIRSIFTEQKLFYKTVAFGQKIHDGIEEIAYSGFCFRFKAILNDAANEYCAENTAILHELVVKIVVILSFFVLMIASHVAFFETEDFSFEDDGVRRNRAASTFLALVVARDSLCSFLEHLARSSVWMRPVTRLRNVYEARVKSTQPKTLRRTRSNVNIC